MLVNAKTFRKWVDELVKKAMDKHAVEPKAWIVLETFFIMRYINYANYLLGDTTLEAEMLTKPGENNAQVLQGPTEPKEKNVQFLEG